VSDLSSIINRNRATKDDREPLEEFPAPLYESIQPSLLRHHGDRPDQITSAREQTFEENELETFQSVLGISGCATAWMAQIRPHSSYQVEEERTWPSLGMKKTLPCVKRWAGIRLIKTNVIKFEIPDEDGSNTKKSGGHAGGHSKPPIIYHQTEPVAQAKRNEEEKNRGAAALWLYPAPECAPKFLFHSTSGIRLICGIGFMRECGPLGISLPF